MKLFAPSGGGTAGIWSQNSNEYIRISRPDSLPTASGNLIFALALNNSCELFSLVALRAVATPHIVKLKRLFNDTKIGAPLRPRLIELARRRRRKAAESNNLHPTHSRQVLPHRDDIATCEHSFPFNYNFTLTAWRAGSPNSSCHSKLFRILNTLIIIIIGEISHKLCPVPPTRFRSFWFASYPSSIRSRSMLGALESSVTPRRQSKSYAPPMNKIFEIANKNRSITFWVFGY